MNKKLTARLTSYRDNIVIMGPEKVHIDLINKCQLNCITCWDHSPYLENPKSGDWKKTIMPYKQVEKITEELAKLNVDRIILSGSGEIFLHPRIMDIIRLIKSRGFKLTIITNVLAITKEQAEEIVNLGVNSVLANVSSASSETYVKFHPNQSKGSWAKLLKLLSVLKNIPDLKLVQVINKINVRELSKMVLLAYALQAKLQLKLAGLNAPGLEQFKIPEEQMPSTNQHFLEAKARAKLLNISGNFDAFQKQLEGTRHKFPIEQIGCYAGYFYSRIWTDGTVFFCCKHIPVGNIYNESFTNIWNNSPDLIKMRTMMNENNYLPACKECGNWNLNHKIHQILTTAKKNESDKIKIQTI